MKKIVGTIAAIALAASSAFAGVGIGSWGRAIWAPVMGDNGGVKTAEVSPWWGGASGDYWGQTGRIGFNVSASGENVGFVVEMTADGNAVGLNDGAYFWATPFSWLTVKIGKVYDDTGRGNAGFGSEDWLRLGVADFNDDFTFKRFGICNSGAIVKITPVEGLWIIAAVNADNNQQDGIATSPLASEVYSKGQYGAGYVIDGIGHMRAQYNGGDKNINAAFDLTAVENLFVSVGAFIPVESGKDTVINAYARINLDALTLHIGEGATINGSTFKNQAAVGLDADLGNGLGVNADVRVANGDDTDLSFMAGIKKGLSNGYIGLGFEGAVKNLTTDASFSWAVPVVISAWF